MKRANTHEKVTTMSRALPMIGLILGATAGSGGALAADEEGGVTQEFVVDAAASDSGRVNGVGSTLSVGATAALNNNSSVVGQVDGSTFNFGMKLDAAVDYNHDQHEWRNTLGIGEGLTRTPLVDDFVKSQDRLALESIYLYHIVPSFGAFARLSLDTAMFRGTDIRPESTTYAIARPDGTVDTVVGDRLTLTGPFRPLTLKQSIGAFARPVAREQVNVEIRAGLGARETIAESQLAVTDDDATPEIEVTELQNVNQLGVEAVVSVWGALEEKRVNYKLSAEVMVPFAYSALPAGDTRGAIDLTNIELLAQLSFKLVEWASLDYQLKAVREPQLLDELQVQNNLLLTFGLTTSSKPGE